MPRRRPKRHRDVVGDLCAGDGNHGGVANRTLREDGYISGAAANVDQADAQLSFIIRQHGIAGRQLLQDYLVDREAAAHDAFLYVLCGVYRATDEVDLHFHSHAGHAEGLLDALLVVDDVFLREDVQNLLIRRNSYRSGGVDHPVHILLLHFVLAYGDDSVRIQALHMAAGNPRVD